MAVSTGLGVTLLYREKRVNGTPHGGDVVSSQWYTRCPTRKPYGRQECPHNCLAIVKPACFPKSVTQECPTSVFHKGVPRESYRCYKRVPARVLYMGPPQAPLVYLEAITSTYSILALAPFSSTSIFSSSSSSSESLLCVISHCVFGPPCRQVFCCFVLPFLTPHVVDSGWRWPLSSPYDCQKVFKLPCAGAPYIYILKSVSSFMTT